MMIKYDRDFKGVWIPKEIWLSDDLTLQEKIFLVEIDSLDNEEGCYANNEHFSKFFGISKVRVSKVINSLIKKGWITSTINKERGNKRILHSLINKSLRPSLTKVNDPIKQKLIHNNTVNNINNNTENNEESQSLKNIIDDIYNLYPNKCLNTNRNLNKTSKDKDKIHSLIKKHSYEEIFIKVAWAVFERYVNEAKDGFKPSMQNFKTLLNNLPDIEPKYKESFQVLIDTHGFPAYDSDKGIDFYKHCLDNLKNIWKGLDKNNNQVIIKSDEDIERARAEAERKARGEV